MEGVKRSYAFALADDQSQFVLNDTVELALQRLHQVVDGAVPDGHDAARSIARSLLARL